MRDRGLVGVKRNQRAVIPKIPDPFFRVAGSLGKCYAAAVAVAGIGRGADLWEGGYNPDIIRPCQRVPAGIVVHYEADGV